MKRDDLIKKLDNLAANWCVTAENTTGSPIIKRDNCKPYPGTER